MNYLSNTVAVEKLSCFALAAVFTGSMVLAMHGLSSRRMASDALLATPSAVVNGQMACVRSTKPLSS